MTRLHPRFRLLALLALGAAASAAPAAAQPVAVKNAWVRAPAPGQQVAGAYMELEGRTRSALIGVTSPVAARAEMHATGMHDGVMSMRPVASIELAPGRAVKLAPGGLHVMLLELKRPLKPGEKVPLTLTVQRADYSRSVFTVEAEVRAAAAGPPGHGGHAGH